MTLLLARLRESGELEAAGGAAYLTETMQSVEVAGHAEHYGRIVADRALKRSIAHRMTEGLREVYSGQSTGQALLQRYRSELERLGDGVDVAERFPTMTAAELAASDIHTEYTIPGVVVAGQAIFFGRSRFPKLCPW